MTNPKITTHPEPVVTVYVPAQRRDDLDVARDIPTGHRRPGSLDAYKLPSLMLGTRIYPKHHAVGGQNDE
jgi:hypothetical protein